jgi:flagellin
MISIQTNANSLIAQQNLGVNTAFQSKTIQQLTSGYRINQAGDDAAGLAVANKFRSTVTELTQGVANGNDATAQLQIMDGGMSNISQVLDRLKTLATQSASGTFTGDRSALNAEFQSDLQEIDRQAQSIGLDTGGISAKSLSVYLGQGSGSQSLNNASVVVDLSQSTVDSGSLGLKGLKAITGTIDPNGTDIGTGSSNGTTVEDIVSANAGNAQATVGYATFNFSGPGFSDSSKVSVAANLAGVSDVSTLVTAINTAIANAGSGATQADQALKSAGIVASVNTDQYGHQQLAFSSPSTAFQVQAGDQMANALMGNFASPGSPTGKAVTTTVTGATTAASTAQFNPTNVSVQISGAGLAGPVNITLNSADTTVGAAASDVIGQVQTNKQLQDAGISASLTSDNKLQFTSATGSTFSVSSTGDTANALGLGTFVTTAALNGAATYSDITAGVSMSTAATGNGVATLGFSLNGGATGGITAATVTGSVGGTGYNGSLGMPNGTVSNAAGALGTMSITLNGSATPVTVNFALDSNSSATESTQKVADFINSQFQAQAGYGSDVKLATVDSTTNTIKLTGTADGDGTVVASGAAAAALGLTAGSGANIVAASGSAGNTVSVNLAGGDATSAVATGTAAAPANVATGTNTMELNIDGVAVNADFSKDVNGAGEAAAFTSATLGANANSTLDISALQGGKASLSSGVLGSSGANTVLDLTGFAASFATTTGTSIAANNGPATVDLTGLASKAATLTGTALGAIANADLSALNLGQYADTTAKVIGGSLGTDSNSAIDLSQFKATKANVTGTVSLGASDGTTAVDYSNYGAQKAKYTGDAVAADDTSTIAALSNLDGTTPSKQLVINGTSIDISSYSSLDDIVGAINGSAAGTAATGVIASDANGVLTVTNKKAGAANPIDIVANEASLAVGLSKVGQIGDTTAVGSGTAATMTGYQVSPNDTTTMAPTLSAITAGAGNNLIIDNGTGNVTSLDLRALTTLDSVVTAINGTALGLSATGVVASDSGGVLTISNKVAGAGSIAITNNESSQALGLTTLADSTYRTAQGTGVGELQLSIDGQSTINVDISGATNGTGVLAAINGALGNTKTGYGSTYNAVASFDAGGHLKFSSVNTGATGGSAGEIHVVQNSVSDQLGLTSGGLDTDKFGTDAAKLKLNIDGLGEQDVDISFATTIGQVADAINAKLNTGYGASYNSVASGATGNLIIGSVVKGTSGTVSVIDDAVSQALHLTSGVGDITQAGSDPTSLKVNIDGHGEVDVNISSASTLDQVRDAINTALHTAGAQAMGYDNAFTYAKESTTVTGALDLVSKNKGETGVNAGSVQVMNNVVSQALNLTTGGTVTKTGTDTQTLSFQLDGHQQMNLDLSAIGASSGHPTTTEIAAYINTQLTNAGGIAAGYGANYANRAVANADGTITLKGYATSGSLKIINNAASQDLGLVTGTTQDTVKSAADKTLNLQIDGHQQVDIDLSTVGGSAGHPTLTEIATAINNALKANSSNGYGTAYGNVASANSDGTITLSGVAGAGTLTVKNSGLSSFLSLTSTTGDATATGAAAQTLDISVDGKATAQVNFSGITGGGTPKLSDIAAAINSQLASAYGSGYASLASANSDGTITIGSKGTGSTGGSVTIANNVAGKALSFTSGTASSATVTGKDESLADVVSFLNTTAQQALGASTAAKIVALDGSGNLTISSQTRGANSSVSVVGAGTTGGLAASLGLGSYVDSATTGQARSLQSVVDNLKQSFNGNATLQAAGLTAQINQGTNSLEISSSNGTQFRIDAWGTKTATTDSDLGFGDTGKAFTNTLSAATSSSSVIDTQGASAIGTFANGARNTASLSFQAMQFGNDDQSISISANSAAGVPQTPLTITLQNDSQAQTGASIDAAISYINTKLQQSDNPTLRSIAAVAETGADGKESINFISSLSSFNVSVSSSAGAAVGDGLNGGNAKTFSSTMNGSASSIAIDTQAGALQAITALAGAVAKLGGAQSTIGRGENQLGYALSLAQSQITNFSVAESQIRDTNVAQQAANLTKAQVLQQASIAAMAQANSAPQQLLTLLRG